MITNLKLHKVASYEDVVEIEPSPINYLYGGNGTGKTSLGSVIADCENHSSCKISWSSSELQTLVYNKQFREVNFSQSDSIKGIFTLGKDSTEAQKIIEEKKEEEKDTRRSIAALEKSVESQNSKAETESNEIVNKAWAIKNKYEDSFRPAYSGFIGSRKAFFDKCFNERSNPSELSDLNTLKSKCDKIYTDSIQRYDIISKIDFATVSELEKSKILKSRIIGKENSEFSPLIEKINNSDWVRDGLKHLEQSHEQCPFCQQKLSDILRQKLEEIFDDSYNEQIRELDDIVENYKKATSNIQIELENIYQESIPIVSFDKIKSLHRLLTEKIKNNQLILDSKKKNPSSITELNSIVPELELIASEISNLNEEIESNNKIFYNLSEEKELLASQIWKFIYAELSVDLESYSKNRDKIQKAIKSISESIETKSQELRNLLKIIKEKEAEATSVVHSVNEINKVLKSFGFTNFSIQEASQSGFYKLVRSDGSVVRENLSEGEYTFITFLYFYHLIKGSTEESGLSQDRVVVIDDPISSLDSNVLFVVSNLTKNIIQDIRAKEGDVKQIFILTHNVYFFKEVTFKSRGNNPWREESFWIIRKPDDKTKIIKHDQNPIKTTYELLWRELDDPDLINSATIFNTLRRILEYYFNILGGINYEKAINEFEGENQLICKSLVSWVNDGSHFINDDLVVDTDPDTISKYLKVFQDIFRLMGHENHFKMMSIKVEEIEK